MKDTIINVFNTEVDLFKTYPKKFHWNLNDIFNDYWDDYKEYISKLVNIRKDYKDALIHGIQSYQPTTGETSVVAYCYEGTKNIIIPIVNTRTSDYIGEVALRVDQAGHVFTDLLSGETYTVAEDGTIKVTISENSLVILQRDFSKNYQQ